MRRWFVFMLFFLAVMGGLTACQSKPTPSPEPQALSPTATATSLPAPTPSPEPTATPVPTETPAPAVTLTDDLGEEIRLAQCPQRIISLAPSITESLFAIGAGELVVGRDTNSKYPPEVASITDIGSLYQNLPLENMLALEPDLVIAAEIISKDQVEQMRKAGLTVFWLANPKDFDGLFENLRTLAQLTCREEEAEALIAQLDERVTAVLQKVADVEERPLVFYELDATDPANPWTTGPGTFIDYAIQAAGGENLGALALDAAWAQISIEKILELNPDILLLADAPYGVTPESVAQRAGWGEIKAVKDGRVYPFDPNLLSVPGPRLVDGLEVLAVIFHPDVFCGELAQQVEQNVVEWVCP